MRWTIKKIGVMVASSLFIAVAYTGISNALDTPIIEDTTDIPASQSVVTDCNEKFNTYNDILLYSRCAGPPDTCFVGGNVTSSGTEVPKDFSLGTDAKDRRINLMKALMTDYGFSAEQASGVIGNFWRETGTPEIYPDVNQGGSRGAANSSGLGYGWAQWSGSRKTDFLNYAVRQGYIASKSTAATDAANYAFLKTELATTFQSTIRALKKTTTAQAAALSFEVTYEQAGSPALDDRVAHAEQALSEYKAAGGQTTAASSSCNSNASGATIVGSTAFPLAGTKKVVKNPGMFHDGTADQGGHPYIAYDILANTGTPVVAFMSGTVTHIGTDRCPGRLVSIYNSQSNMTISYLHMDMDTMVTKGQQIQVGQQVGIVGPAANGCGIPHLHIDAVTGKVRVGCSRLNCPVSNQKYFINIGPQLYTTYQALPD